MPVYQDSKLKTWYFRCYITNSRGERKQICRKGFKTKRDAQFQEMFIIDDSQRYEVVEEGKTLNDIFNDYKEYLSIHLKPQGYRSTVSKITNNILPFFGHMKPADITNVIFIEWQKEMEGKGYKYSHLKSIHGCMVGLLKYCCNFYGLDKNVALLCGGFRRKTELEREVDFWTFDEYQKFISVVDELEYKVLFDTLYYTGMRQGEALGLTWNDFVKGSYLNINKTKAKGMWKDGKVLCTPPKTKQSKRMIAIDKHLIEEIKELKKYYQEKVIDFSEEWFIFGGLFSLSETTIGRKKDEWARKAEVKQIRIHDFRHSHASMLLSQNVPITVIQQRLGHADLAVTLNTYSHMLPKDIDKAIEAIDTLRK